MTYLDAALAVLQAAGQPLHYAEITTRALAQGLIEPSGLTPEASITPATKQTSPPLTANGSRTGCGPGIAGW